MTRRRCGRATRRSEPQAGDDQRRGERKSDDHVEGMRAERIDADDADAGQGPQRAEGDRRDGEPAPHPEARERERGRGHDRQIDVERPVIRPLRGDEKRRDIGADEAEARERRPMQERGGERRQRHQGEQDESRARRRTP